MTSETFSHLPLAAIVASLTNPRRTFDAARLQELAESIRASGVHQPVLVRPLPASRVADTASLHPRPTFELVSGERRFRASGFAGMTTVPAMVRDLTDDQVLEIQLVENLQRDDLQPLEEAEGYERLMNAHTPALTAEQIGQRIGKSRSYVYARLKLLDLCLEGQQALRDGHINAAVALLIARIPSQLVQAQALGNVHNPLTGTALSVRDAGALIQRQYMLRLAEASFDLEDATLVPGAGPCSTCPKRTGADPDLFADVPGANVCTDSPCFRAKEQARQQRTLQAARESGAQVIEGREALQITLRTTDGRLDGYLRLDDKRDSPEKGQTLRQVIGHLLEPLDVQPTLVAMPEHEPVAVITTAQATRLLGIKADADNTARLQAQKDKGGKEAAQAAAELQKQQDHEHFNTAWRWRVLERAWGKISTIEDGMYSLPEAAMRQLAREHLPNRKEPTARLCELLGLGEVGQAHALVTWVNEHPDPDRALALLLLFEAATNWQAPLTGGAVFMTAIAEDTRVELDMDAIRDEVQAEHTAAIKARTKVQAGATCTESQTPSVPLASAAQAKGGRGAKGKTAPAAPAVKKPKTSAGEARQGIAAAMQGMESPATPPDAGASRWLHAGAKVQIKTQNGQYHGRIGRVQHLHPDCKPEDTRKVWVVDIEPDDEDMSHLVECEEQELTVIMDEVAWPFPGVAAT
jgi:ParB/RepB/Spo0J family partition protein